jgi:hypothetical protein
LEGEITGGWVDLDIPCSNRARGGVVEYNRGLIQPAHPLARHPLRTSFAWTNAHSQPLTINRIIDAMFSLLLTGIIFQLKNLNKENGEKIEDTEKFGLNMNPFKQYLTSVEKWKVGRSGCPPNLIQTFLAGIKNIVIRSFQNLRALQLPYPLSEGG